MVRKYYCGGLLMPAWLQYGETVAARSYNWDEQKHPRHEKGDPRGGQFAPGGGGGSGGAAAAADEAETRGAAAARWQGSRRAAALGEVAELGGWLRVQGTNYGWPSLLKET